VSAGRKAWKVAWRLGVCLLLLAWIFQLIFYNEGRLAYEKAGKDWHALTRGERFNVAWSYGPSGLLETLSSMDPKYLVLSVMLMGVILFLGVIRWQIILNVHGLKMRLSRSTEISLIAHFFNSFLLGSVGGDLLKAYYVARETHHKKTEAVVTVAVDRVVGLFSMLLLACLMMLPNLQFITATPQIRMVTWIILLMTIGCAGFMVVAFWGGISKGVPRAREWLRKLPKGDVFERTLGAFREFGKDRWFILRVLPVSMIANVVCILHFLVLLWGFHLKVPVLALAVIVPIVTCISTLPITPSGLGVRENLYVLTLAAPGLDVPPAEALLVSLVGYATSLFWSAIGGFVYATVRKKEHLEEIDQDESEFAAGEEA
jgi:glycosyltransferase 2 family protein